MKPSGHWYVPCDVETLDSNGLTELDKVWTAVGELVKEKVFIQAAYQRSSFPVVSGSTVYTTVVINCYVENYLDIHNVLHSATEFKKKVYYPYPLFLKTTSELFPGKLQTLVQYLHCLDGDLYQFVPGRSFQLVKRNASI